MNIEYHSKLQSLFIVELMTGIQELIMIWILALLKYKITLNIELHNCSF